MKTHTSTGKDWDSGKPSEWKSKEAKGGGIFRLNVAGLFNDDANECVAVWNKSRPKEAINLEKFRRDDSFRKDVLTKLDQNFNTLWASHLLMRNMVFQDHFDRAGCLNPFMRRLNILPVFSGTPSPEIFSCTKKIIKEKGFSEQISELGSDSRKSSGKDGTH